MRDWQNSPRLVSIEPGNPGRVAPARGVWLLFVIAGSCAAACSGGSFTTSPPPPSAKQALYVSTGLTPNSLLTFIFDTGTGTVAAPTSIAGAPAGIDVKVHPGGDFLYVSDFNSGSVYGYSINRSTGALTALAGSPFSFSGHSGNGGPMALDPAGKFLFSANSSGQIVSYTISSQTGILMPGTAPMVTDSNQPVYLITDATGNFLIASNHADSSGRNYSVYAINSTTAVLTEVPGSPFSVGQNTAPQQILLNSGNSVLYAALSNSQQVNAINFAAATGQLTPFQGAPYPAQSNPMGLALLPSGQFLYAGNNGANSISEFKVDSAGALTAGNVVQAGNPTFLDIDPSGQFLVIVGENSNVLTVFRIDASTGGLTMLNTTDLPPGAGTRAISFLVPLQ